MLQRQLSYNPEYVKEETASIKNTYYLKIYVPTQLFEIKQVVKKNVHLLFW